MTTVALSVDLIVDIPNMKVSTRVQRVSDSQGSDRTSDFLMFCNAKSLPIATQAEVEHAITAFVKAHEGTLP